VLGVVGKSTLMTQFQDLLRKENSKVSILAINKDMPEFRFLAEKNWKWIYDYIISKRYKIYAEESYQEVVTFLIDSVGSRVSAGNIAKVLSTNKKRIDNKTVSKYIDTLVEAYLFYKVNRFDIKGKQHLASQEKYYLVDLGFRNALLGKELASDAGHLLENIIYLELKRRNNQVWIGKTNNLEVDFVVRNNEGFTHYIQVSQTVENAMTLLSFEDMNKIYSGKQKHPKGNVDANHK